MNERDKSLSAVLKIFGIPIKGNLCRTSNVEDHRTLYIGNLKYGMTSNEIMSSINHLLSSSLKVYIYIYFQIELEDHSPEGICINNHGYCFIEFENHSVTNFAYSRKLKVGWSLKPSRNEKCGLLASIDDIAISKSFDILNVKNNCKYDDNIESDVEYDNDDF